MPTVPARARVRPPHAIAIVALTVIATACQAGSTPIHPSAPVPASAGATEARASRVTICHVDDAGAFAAITISDNAVAAHRAHGDLSPGDAAPGQAGFELDNNCQAAPLLA